MNTPPDPYRIKRILNKLETIWSAYPDESFNQIWGYRLLLGSTEDGVADWEIENALDRCLKDRSLTPTWKS